MSRHVVVGQLGLQQSASWPCPQAAAHAAQPVGQKPSDVPLQARAEVTHANVHAATEPVRVRTVLRSPTQASYCIWHADGGSHFSPVSTAPLPQVGVQLLSLLALQPDGQQPSLGAHAVMGLAVFTHFAVHALVFGSSLIVWMPLLSPLPEVPRLEPLMRMLFLFFQSIVPTVPASFLTFGARPLYSFYDNVPRLFGSSALGDTSRGSVVLMPLLHPWTMFASVTRLTI